MSSWLESEITEPGRLPLFLCLLSFVVTFLATRVITRMIRLGRGPFNNNVSESGLHIHHAVPGLVVLITGAFIALGAGQQDAWASVAGVLVGIGTSLVLDEFALILRLDDVYWSEEGRKSVEVVALAAAVLGLLVLGFEPFAVDDGGEGGAVPVIVGLVVFALHLAMVAIVVAKGRYSLALMSLFIPVMGFVLASRLARPESRWAKRRYGPAKLERARKRAARHDHRYVRNLQSMADFVAGAPDGAATDPDPEGVEASSDER